MAVAGSVQDSRGQHAASVVKALPQVCGICEESVAVPYDQWLDGDEVHISRLDEWNYCIVLDVVPRGNGTGVKLSLQAFSRGGQARADPSASRIEWSGGSVSPSAWTLCRDGGCSCGCILRGSMCFDGIPSGVLKEEPGFRFGGAGFSLVQLSLSRSSATSGGADGNAGSSGASDVKASDVLAISALAARPGPVVPLPAASSRSKSRQALNVVVSTLSGEVMHSLRASPCDTVYEVKQRLARLASIDVGQLQLVYGCARLKDSETLESSCRSGARASLADILDDTEVREQCPLRDLELHLYCLRVGRSSIASHFEEMRNNQNPKLAQCASLADLVDPVMQLENTMSEQRRPRPEAVLASIPANVRSRFIAWMMEAFDALQFDSFILFGAVLTMDRYCASVHSPRDHGEMGLELLAAICTEMKLAREDQFTTELTRRLLHHICQGRFALQDIFRTELAILTELGFAVWVPTPLHFFGGLALRLGSGETPDDQPAATEALPCFYLGLLLLHISLLDAELQYNYPHAIVAAAALSGAIGVLGEANEQREDLLKDLAAYRPASAGAADEELVLRCEESLLTLWWQCTTGESPHAEFFGAIEARFASPTHQRVSRLSPRHRLSELRSLRSIPAEKLWAGGHETGQKPSIDAAPSDDGQGRE